MKHWIVNASWCGSHGFNFPDDVCEIPAADLDAIPTGRSDSIVSLEAPRSRPEMLDYLGSRLSGSGIEFGAGHSPFPVNPGCEVVLADRNTPEELRSRCYFGDHQLVPPHLICDLEYMECLTDASVDFIIASHVIEHTRNPLGAFRQAYKKLRASGQFVLVVPDMIVTFDKNRPLTSLDHLILDDVQPSRERDF